MNESTRINLPTLRGIVYKEGDRWISHCLELDIVGQGDSPEEAMRQSIELCVTQITVAIEDSDIESIFCSAPKEIWALYVRGFKEHHHQSQPNQHAVRAEFRELCPS